MKFAKVTIGYRECLLNLDTIQTITKKNATQYELTLSNGTVYTISHIAYKRIIELIGISPLDAL